ncbi:ribonuclease P protein component [Corynebacterium uterequi]|uniref:Ribonuclease P protein component n=1 Tax=Corynebacterium uterequi TaxID=1072256 RepID=A0A0G3HHG3_9CORY|nr:ribonuclease P protein component [Corynebacterium uterequi]AKK12195.1 ribonuclease P protein component [Corynebacterium uterequi]
MLPKRLKLSSPTQFSRVMRKGRKAGSRTVVVHVYDRSAESSPLPANVGGPRFGLIVSKAVGNAVARHALSRRLRHVAAAMADELPSSYEIVLRALPAAATATSHQLAYDIAKALKRIERRG